MSSFNSKQIKIAELVDSGFVFEIPDYQRGYRWGKTEVIDLLEDIQDVIKENVHPTVLKSKCEARPYCLQPIAFDTAKEHDLSMIVVDGQQRLTTIFLILKYICERFSAYSPEMLEELTIDNPDQFFKEINLVYEDPTRNGIFEKVKCNLNVTNTDNIDAYYITEAYKHIVEWGKYNIKRASELNSFSIKFFYGTSIIWYEIDKTTDGSANDYFAKTNTGRIPLTNSELIKANLMLDEYCVKKDLSQEIIDDSDEQRGKKEDELRRLNMERLENQRIKISRQWDTIENELRSDEFWYFLTENSDEYEDTRIDYIFNIVARELYSELNLGYASIDEFYELNRERAPFIIIARYLKCNEHRDDANKNADPIGVYVWKKAWNTYMTFKDWYDNREWYHFIGFILSANDKYSAEDILKIFKNKEFTTKAEIKAAIRSLVEESGYISSRDENGNIVKRSLDEYKNYLQKLSYNKDEERNIIKRILLLFNVISVLNDNKEMAKTSRDTFFPFARYKKERWNLEHIHSKADDVFSLQFAKEYVFYIQEMIKRLDEEDSANSKEKDSLKKVLEVYETKKTMYVSDGHGEDEAIKLAAQDSSQQWILAYSDDLDDKYINGIGNMALLDETTNKSYHNAPFFMKRMIISDIVMGKKKDISRFIPFCTRNVFDKTYTKLPSVMLHWNHHDFEDYANAIAEIIYVYFEGGDK